MKQKHAIFYNNSKLKGYIRRYGGADWKDFYQDMYFIIEKLDDELIKDLMERNRLEAYYAEIIFKQLISKNTAFFKTYRKANKNNIPFGMNIESTDSPYDYEQDELTERKLKAFKHTKEHPKEIKEWYNANVCERVAEIGSLRKASKELGIKYRTIHYAVQQTKEILNKKLKSI